MDIIAESIDKFNQKGKYEWGSNDCVSLFLDIYEKKTGKTSRILKNWLALSYGEAMEKALQECLTVENAYCTYLKPYVKNFRMKNLNQRPEVILLTGKQEVANGGFLHPAGDAMLAFITKYGQIWGYESYGLVRLTNVDPVKIWEIG